MVQQNMECKIPCFHMQQIVQGQEDVKPNLTLRYTGGGHYDHPLAKTAPIHYWVTFEGPHCGTIPIS